MTDTKTTKLITEYTAIDDVQLNNQQLNNPKSYYSDVGGEGVLSSSSLELQKPLDLHSLGVVNHLINQLNTSKATSQEDFPNMCV